jgi:hypothetical protein
MLPRHGSRAIVLSLFFIGIATAQEGIAPSELSFEESPEPATSGEEKLFGLFRPSDRRFEEFISPMTNPVFFEDPRNVTEARAIFLNHHLPNSVGGKDAQLYAVQLRAALTENLSFIATKDGYVVSQNPLMDDGFADLAAGLKYLLFKDADSQTLFSVGATYAFPFGSTQTLQGRCDGESNVFATAGTEFLPSMHYVTTSGFRLPSNSQKGNQIWYWSNHVDWQVFESRVYLFTECNWYHYLSSANAFGAPVGGMDLFNLGSVGIAGQNTVTGAYGLKFKPTPNMELGVAYEIPYSHRHDILQNRLTVDFIIRY